jgi:exodeoxyribonuclease-1
LESLSKANGLLHEAAHDALSDVYATIALAKLVKQHHPELYAYAYSLKDKRKVASIIDVAQRKPLLHTTSRFPAAQGCTGLIMPLAEHPSNKNSVICYDLSIDPQPLLTLSADEICERLYVKQQDLPEGCERIPLKEVHLNKSPIVATAKLLDIPAADRLGIDKSLCEHHWQQLRHADIASKIQQVFLNNHFPPKSDAEQQLYDGFINSHDKQLYLAIRGAAPETLAAYAEKLKDPRLKVLLFRYRARHFPNTLSDVEMKQWQQWRYQRLSDADAGGSIVLEAYFERLSSYSDNPEVNQTIVQNLLDYGDALLE